MKISRSAFLLRSVSLAAGLLLASWGASAQGAPEGILVYNAQHASLTQAWAEAFTKELSLIHI